MKVLVINAGSSSIKYQLIEMNSTLALCIGVVERIGTSIGKLTHKACPGTAEEHIKIIEQPFPTHRDGLLLIVSLLTDPDWGVIKSKDEIEAIGHRVVQGGEIFDHSCIVTPKVIEDIRSLIPLAPLHNPGHLQGIETAIELFPEIPSVVVFDTEFHRTMPDYAFMYPIPYEFYTDCGIRRYGFHGTSHRYVSKTCAQFLNKPITELNLITCHLGNGASLAAIKQGKCIDTTMGLTPLDGLMMGTRSGDIDPAIVAYIASCKGMSPLEIDLMLNKECGFKGICGLSDMRDVHDAVENGDPMAKLAFNMYIYRIIKYIGSYYAILKHVDAIVLTAGIGENDQFVRKAICNGLAEPFGVIINDKENSTRSSKPRILSTPESKIIVAIIPTDEELEIAETTLQVLGL